MSWLGLNKIFVDRLNTNKVVQSIVSSMYRPKSYKDINLGLVSVTSTKDLPKNMRV